jgi:hypothetical protein
MLAVCGLSQPIFFSFCDMTMRLCQTIFSYFLRRVHLYNAETGYNSCASIVLTLLLVNKSSLY